MIRPRDRSSSFGLLPCMEARPWKDGKTYTYRILAHGKWVNLGTDRAEALRKALDLNNRHDDMGTIGRLWLQYKDTSYWSDLKPRTQKDYADRAKLLLRVFADVQASAITPPILARYLRVERKDAPVRANREVRMLGLLIQLAIERGEATTNPCRDRMVRFNKERPRSESPDPKDMQALVGHAMSKGGQWQVIAMAAEFAALAGARQVEFLQLHWPAFGEDEVRLDRGKQRKGTKKVDRIQVSPALLELRGRLLAHQGSPLGAVFPNRHGNSYTGQGFACLWGRLMREAVGLGLVKRRFTFHDLRAHYATEHKRQTGALPDMHSNPATTARVYERSHEAKRKSL